MREPNCELPICDWRFSIEGNTMDKQELKKRTKQSGLRVMKLAGALRRGRTEDIVSRQLVRSGTSVGADYRAACRARSRADFASKIAIAEEEADETGYWLEVIVEGELMSAQRVKDLLMEANELTAILAASDKTARINRNSTIDNRE